MRRAAYLTTQVFERASAVRHFACILRRLGYEAEAQQLADGVIGTVAREGLREYYDPHDGNGMGAKDFTWSALVAELADPKPLYL